VNYPDGFPGFPEVSLIHLPLSPISLARSIVRVSRGRGRAVARAVHPVTVGHPQGCAPHAAGPGGAPHWTNDLDGRRAARSACPGRRGPDGLSPPQSAAAGGALRGPGPSRSPRPRRRHPSFCSGREGRARWRRPGGSCRPAGRPRPGQVRMRLGVYQDRSVNLVFPGAAAVSGQRDGTRSSCRSPPTAVGQFCSAAVAADYAAGGRHELGRLGGQPSGACPGRWREGRARVRSAFLASDPRCASRLAGAEDMEYEGAQPG